MKTHKPDLVRYAVVGLGNIAQEAVLPAFRHAGRSRLVALVSSADEKLRELSKRYRGVEVIGGYDDLEEVIDQAKVDAVYIAVPNALHRDMTERAASAGAHVICEKPMAMSVADCEAMIDAAADNDVKLMVAYRLHFDPTNLKAIERIQKGEIGEPRLFSSVFAHEVRPGDIRTRGEVGGGALYDLGTYCINAARYIFRAEPMSVQGMQVVGTEDRFEDVDEASAAVLRFPNDRVATFAVSQGAADISEFRVIGTKGDIELEPAFEYAERLRQRVKVGSKEHEKRGKREDQFAPEIEHFSTCILEDETPEPSGEEGLADVRVLEAIVQSAQTGTAVSLPPMERTKRPTRAQEMRKPPVGKQRTVHAPSPSK